MTCRLLVAESPRGTRTIAGTDHPVVDLLHRTGQRSWVVTRELCNGVPRSSETYRSESAAREAFGAKLDGRKPRGSSAGRPLTLRVTDEERAAWSAAAELEQVTLGEWMRRAAELRAR